MKIENLKGGLIIKNYKELCKVLDLKESKSMGTRNAQIKELERYVVFHKEGQKFIIDEIYEEVKDKMDNRSNGNNSVSYIQYIQKLILDLLVQSYYKESVCLSKNKLFKELKMINDNYSFCKTRIPKLSKFTGIHQETIDEWYSSTDTTLKGNVEKALDNLKRQSLIIWTNEISVCKMEVQSSFNGLYDIHKKVTYDEYNEEVIKFNANTYVVPEFREATDIEKKFIIHTERDIMLEMGFDDKADIVRYGLWNEFKNKINKIILKELNIDFYYNSYKILFNQDHILQKYEEFIDDLLLSKEERLETQKILNEAVTERLNSNIIKKQNRALKETEKWFGDIQDEKLKRRTSENYLENNKTLVNTLIDVSAETIKNKIKKIKIEKITN